MSSNSLLHTIFALATFFGSANDEGNLVRLSVARKMKRGSARRPGGAA